MDAIILCGGLSTRLRSITQDKIPKILVPINGRPFLEYLIDTLYSQGVRRMVLAAGFRGGVLRDYRNNRCLLSNGNPWMQLDLIEEDQPLGTGGAVLNVLNSQHIHSNPFLIVNADTLILSDGADSYEQIYYTDPDGSRADFCIFSCHRTHDGRYGVLKCDDHDIVGLQNNKEGRGWINCGYYIARQEVFDKFKSQDPLQTYNVTNLSMETDIIPSIIKDGWDVKRLDMDEKSFIEIGDPGAITDAERRLA